MVRMYFSNLKNVYPYLIIMIVINCVFNFLGNKAVNISKVTKTITLEGSDFTYPVTNSFINYDYKYIAIYGLVFMAFVPILGIFIRLIFLKLLNDEEFTKGNLFKKSFKYLNRYILLGIILYLLGLSGSVITSVFRRAPLIAVLFYALWIYLSIIFAVACEYMICHDETVLDSLIESRKIGKVNWVVIVGFSIVIGLFKWIEKTTFDSNMWPMFAIFALIGILIDTYFIMYRMNMCVNESYYAKEKFYEKMD